MPLSEHEQAVNTYYDVHTQGFYLGGWHPVHIHFGIFDEAKVLFYQENPINPVNDRDAAVKRMTSLIVDSANIQPGDLVVDAGSGVGGTALHIATALGNTVIGLNLNEQQIAIAQDRTREAVRPEGPAGRQHERIDEPRGPAPASAPGRDGTRRADTVTDAAEPRPGRTDAHLDGAAADTEGPAADAHTTASALRGSSRVVDSGRNRDALVPARRRRDRAHRRG